MTEKKSYQDDFRNIRDSKGRKNGRNTKIIITGGGAS